MITLTFSLEQLAVLDRALQAMPYREVAALIADINRQISESKDSENEPV